MAEIPKLYTAAEAAEMLGISMATLRREIDERRIAYVEIGRRKRFRADDLEAYAGGPLSAGDVARPEEGPATAINVQRLYEKTRASAKARSLPHTLTKTDLYELARRSRGACELTGIRFSEEVIGGQCPYTASVDRIDSAKGYSLSNCRLVCFAVNLALNSWGDDVLRRIARHLVQADWRREGR